jgi:hypothetical protein
MNHYLSYVLDFFSVRDDEARCNERTKICSRIQPKKGLDISFLKTLKSIWSISKQVLARELNAMGET